MMDVEKQSNGSDCYGLNPCTARVGSGHTWQHACQVTHFPVLGERKCAVKSQDCRAALLMSYARGER